MPKAVRRRNSKLQLYVRSESKEEAQQYKWSQAAREMVKANLGASGWQLR